MKKYIGIVLMVLGYGNITYAQVGMVTNKSNKDAVLDLNNTSGINTKGLLLPKVALTATNSAAPLAAHVAGMHVYNTAMAGSGAYVVTPGEYYNDGSKWIRLQANAWELTGNAATNPSAHFVGTTDAVDLVTRTTNTERMRVNSAGKVLVGTTTVPTGGTNAKMIVDNGTIAGAIQIKDGTQGDGFIMVSNSEGVGSWFEPGNTALGTGLYRNTVAQTFPKGVETTLQTSQPIKVAVSGTYMATLRWIGTSNGAQASNISILSAYFKLYKNGVFVDQIEYYVPVTSGTSFSASVNLLATNCAVDDVLTIKVVPSIGGGGNIKLYTGTVGGTNPIFMPSILVIKL